MTTTPKRLPVEPPDHVPVRITVEAARALTEAIKHDAAQLWDKIVTAYTERAWDVLGYGTWDSYCAAEFGSVRLRLPREERRDAVCSLRESGLSTRAIAAAVGVDQKTVRNDLDAGEENSSPVEPVVDAEVVKSTPVTGTDGKTYRPKRKPKPKPPKPEQPTTTEPPGGLTENSPGQTDRVKQALENAKAASGATEPAPDDSDTGPDFGIVLPGIAADLDKLAVYVTSLDTDARLKVADDHFDAINGVSRKLQRMIKALRAAQKIRAQEKEG